MRASNRMLRNRQLAQKRRSWTPKYLFTTGVNGAWYDPSDINLTWRRNLLTYTEQFDNAAWVKTNATVTANAAVAPDGTLTADKLVENTATSTHQAYQNYTPTQLSNVVFSVYAKAAERSVVTLLEPTGAERTFNLGTGVATGSGASMVSAGDGWWRCIASGALIDTATRSYALRLNNGSSVTYTGDGTSGIYIWGAQLELGSTATTYQKITDGIKDYLDYKPLPILYQDAAGITPVTAVGQPVGLMLDKSKGLVLGPELVTNGGFDTDTTWIKGTGWSISGGAAIKVAGVNADIYQSAPTYGKFCVVEINVTVSAGSIFVRLAGAAGPTITATGYYKFYITAGSTGVQLAINASSTYAGSIDNISVRELPGNHAFNPSGNSANFPVLSARYNLLTKTEDFSDAVWVKSNISLASGVADSIGGNSAFTLTATSNFGSISQSGIRAGTFVSSIWIRRRYGSGGVQILSADGNTWVSVTVTSQWTRFTDIKTSTNLGGTGVRLSVSGDAVDIAFADLRVTNDALNQPTYQRVNTATDYDTVGFKPYLSFNGVNQWLQTNSIDFTYGDKMFVSAGVRKLSDATAAIIAELSSNWNTNEGAFSLQAPPLAAQDRYFFGTRGSLQTSASVLSGYPAPITNVLGAVGNISGDQAILRINGAQVAMDTADQGTGNYGNYPLYIGARTGTSLWFNGRLYGLVVAGKQATSDEITNTESFLAIRTGYIRPGINGIPTIQVSL